MMAEAEKIISDDDFITAIIESAIFRKKISFSARNGFIVPYKVRSPVNMHVHAGIEKCREEGDHEVCSLRTKVILTTTRDYIEKELETRVFRKEIAIVPSRKKAYALSAVQCRILTRRDPDLICIPHTYGYLYTGEGYGSYRGEILYTRRSDLKDLYEIAREMRKLSLEKEGIEGRIASLV